VPILSTIPVNIDPLPSRSVRFYSLGGMRGAPVRELQRLRHCLQSSLDKDIIADLPPPHVTKAERAGETFDTEILRQGSRTPEHDRSIEERDPIDKAIRKEGCGQAGAALEQNRVDSRTAEGAERVPERDAGALPGSRNRENERARPFEALATRSGRIASANEDDAAPTLAQQTRGCRRAQHRVEDDAIGAEERRGPFRRDAVHASARPRSAGRRQAAHSQPRIIREQGAQSDCNCVRLGA
jgi:hypothetical protein